jgi:hypothetical protein
MDNPPSLPGYNGRWASHESFPRCACSIASGKRPVCTVLTSQCELGGLRIVGVACACKYCGADGKHMTELGRDESELVEYVPGRFKVLVPCARNTCAVAVRP